MENKPIVPAYQIAFVVLFLIVLIVFMGKIAYWLAWVSVYDSCKWFLTCGSESRTEITLHDEIKWQPKKPEIKPIEAPKKKEPVKVPPKVEKPKETPKETKVTINNCTSKVRNDLVNHAYKISGGDMKFLGTIASESLFDVNSVWDGGKSLGLCQFHKGYQPDNWKAYQTLDSDFAKLEFCHEKYSIWKKKGILHKRLYGYNVYKKWLEKLEIVCNK